MKENGNIDSKISHGNMSDLKLIDELLCLMKPIDCRWEQFEFQYSITQIAIERLRKAWESGEMKNITLSLSNYFKIKCDRCPECNDKLVLIQNDRMDFKLEIIPTCNKCKKAFRDSKLGWKIIEDNE